MNGHRAKRLRWLAKYEHDRHEDRHYERTNNGEIVNTRSNRWIYRMMKSKGVRHTWRFLARRKGVK